MAAETSVAVKRATVRITDLTLRTIIGFNEWERRKKQDVVINIAFECDPSDAVVSDAVEDTVDYKKMKRRIIDLVEKADFSLLEKLTHAVLAEVMADSRVLSARVRIDKPHALRFARSVSVEMTAERNS